MSGKVSWGDYLESVREVLVHLAECKRLLEPFGHAVRLIYGRNGRPQEVHFLDPEGNAVLRYWVGSGHHYLQGVGSSQAGPGILDLARDLARELARDPSEDLRLCQGVPAGPWFWNQNTSGGGGWPPLETVGGYYRATGELFGDGTPDMFSLNSASRSVLDIVEGDLHPKAAEFIEAARQGWPAALRRLITAEARVKRLQAENATLGARVERLEAQLRAVSETAD